MTRGTLFLALPDEVLNSIEFNGDMYVEDGRGEVVIPKLLELKTKKEFVEWIEKFNDEFFGYEESELVYSEKLEKFTDVNGEVDIKMLNDVPYSDYIYFKNNSKETIIIIDENRKKIEVKDGEVVVFNFHEFELKK